MTDIEAEARDQGFTILVGIDEAGRGPLAGPVVAAAVSLTSPSFTNKINDSKKLSPEKRQALFVEIFERAYVGIGIISETTIDHVNILNATYLAMARAVDQLIGTMMREQAWSDKMIPKTLLLVDGNRFRSDLPFQVRTVVKGDEFVPSIQCASVVAKVARDRILAAYHQIFPDYGFHQHKGYPTTEHRKAIRRFGLSPIHRRSFQQL